MDSSGNMDDFGDTHKKTTVGLGPRGEEGVKSKETDIITPNQWTYVNNNILVPCTKTISILEPGYYEICSLQNGIGFKKKEIKTDELIKFSDSLSAQVLDEINKFWKLYDKFTRLGFLHRRGYLFYGPPGSGKAQPLYSKIKIPNGWTTMGDIKLGEKVCTPDGKISNVIGLFPQGKKDIYRIHFKDGRYSDCCKDHLWKVYNKEWKLKWKILSLKQINDYITTYKGKLYIPLNNCVYGHKQKLQIDPYVMGSLIANGHMKNDVRISSSNNNFINKFKNKLIENYKLRQDSDNDYTIVRENKSNKGHYFKKGNYINYYKIVLDELGLLGKLSPKKFIPKIYLESSYEQRLQLLNGLIDNDGYVSKHSNIEYYTSSYKLAIDFQYLIWSIGGICNITEKLPKYKYKNQIKYGKKAYRCHIKFQHPSLLITTKFKNRLKDNLTIQLKNQIISIEQIGKEECQCILIDHPDHLYITDNFVSTHNTCLVKQIIEQIINNDGIVFDCRHPGHLNRALEMFRGIEISRRIVCTFEDLDAIIRDYGEDALLSLLDGENQVDRVLNIATTNYPEALDKRLVARPRRFDRVYKIDMPTSAHRKIYFQTKLDEELLSTIDIDKWVNETDKFSWASLSELIVSVFCLDH